jgi:tetratricopeptide (TPR) repeat protein
MWDSVLAEPVPPSELTVARGMVLFARGGAFAATRRPADAGAALDTIRALAAAEPEGTRKRLLGIAEHALAGEIARRDRDWDGAERHLRAGVSLEEALSYMEPPYWHHPVRHALGAVLLEAGRPREAEVVYRAALEKFPENGWGLAGLQRSLEAQGKRAEAAQVSNRLHAAWKGAGHPTP